MPGPRGPSAKADEAKRKLERDERGRQQGFWANQISNFILEQVFSPKMEWTFKKYLFSFKSFDNIFLHQVETSVWASLRKSREKIKILIYQIFWQ